MPASAAQVVAAREIKLIDDGGRGLRVPSGALPSTRCTLDKDDKWLLERHSSCFGEATYVVGAAAPGERDGYFSTTVAIDDVVKVPGHPRSIPEVEPAIVSHPKHADSRADATAGSTV